MALDFGVLYNILLHWNLYFRRRQCHAGATEMPPKTAAAAANRRSRGGGAKTYSIFFTSGQNLSQCFEQNLGQDIEPGLELDQNKNSAMACYCSVNKRDSLHQLSAQFFLNDSRRQTMIRQNTRQNTRQNIRQNIQYSWGVTQYGR